jgi:hypothetical protein
VSIRSRIFVDEKVNTQASLAPSLTYFALSEHSNCWVFGLWISKACESMAEGDYRRKVSSFQNNQEFVVTLQQNQPEPAQMLKFDGAGHLFFC